MPNARTWWRRRRCRSGLLWPASFNAFPSIGRRCSGRGQGSEARYDREEKSSKKRRDGMESNKKLACKWESATMDLPSLPVTGCAAANCELQAVDGRRDRLVSLLASNKPDRRTHRLTRS